MLDRGVSAEPLDGVGQVAVLGIPVLEFDATILVAMSLI